MAVGKCALCNQVKELQMSHIIPNFVGKYLKATSGTGYLVDIVNPNTRRQDSHKIPLLCEDCEGLFSRYESYFAEGVFHPFFKNGISTFDYDDNLKKFIISLSWRILKVSYDDFIRDYPKMQSYIDKAEEDWREYLLGISNKINIYENHLMFLDYIDKNVTLPDGFQWYSLRAADGSLVGNNDHVYTCIKFPWMFFVTTIHPRKKNGWNNTKIEDVGKILSPQIIDDVGFGDFYVQRAVMVMSILRDASADRVIRDISKNPDRFLSSKSFEVSLIESKRKREKVKPSLPNGVRELVEIIERSLEPVGLDEDKKKLISYAQRSIADSLTYVEKPILEDIDKKILHALTLSGSTKKNTQCYFETNEIISGLLVDLSESKQEQQEKLKEELEIVLKGKKPEDNRIVVLFSFNPKLMPMPYETLYYI